MLHELLEASQKSPVAPSQSIEPQAQSSLLASVPSVVAQGTKERHEFNEDVQKRPVPGQQSTEPHLQTPPFSEALPRHMTSVWLQLPEEDAHTSPVADVHAPDTPQTQGAGLAVTPSPWMQLGLVKAHRQALEPE